MQSNLGVGNPRQGGSGTDAIGSTSEDTLLTEDTSATECGSAPGA